MLQRPVPDPLAAPSLASGLAPATAAVLIVVDDAADRAQLTAATRTLVRAVAPEVAEPVIVTSIGSHRAIFATVGPFTVEERSRNPLRVALALAFALIAALAGWIAWRARGVR